VLVLAGKNNIAVNALNYVVDNYVGDFSIICNHTDDGHHGWQRSLKKTASDYGVREISLEEAYEEATVFISLEYDRLVHIEKFKKARAYNIHFSLLPKYKGMYTSIWPLLNGEVTSGVTLHHIDNGIDTGSIIDQNKICLTECDRASDLYRKYLASSFDLFKRQFKSMIAGDIYAEEQPEKGSTYYSKNSIDFSSLTIDLNQTAHCIARQIYAYSFREYQLPVVMQERIVEVEILDKRSSLKPGFVIKKEADYLTLATIDYDIRLYIDRIDRLEQFASCSVDYAKVLLKGLCGVHDRDKNGWSPIIIAAYHGNYEVVAFLLKKNANVNDVNRNGTSVLMYAKDYCLKSKDRSLFDFLIHKGADINHKDFYGKTLVNYLTENQKAFFSLK